MVCDAGEKYFAPTLIGGIGADWHGCEQVCGIAGSDSGKKISPLHWLLLWLTGRVANRYAVLLVAIGVKNLAVHWVAHLAVVR